MFKKIVFFVLKLEARLMLARHRPRIIAVTGSVGKTSTKEAIWTLLCEHYHARKSPKSYNSEIGVPLTILGLDNAWNSAWGWCKNFVRGFFHIVSRGEYPEVLILEMGVDRPGDFDRLLSYVHPDTVVVTTMGEIPVHVEFFAGPENMAREKSKLVAGVKKGGTVIINVDDPIVAAMEKKTKERVLHYGFTKGAEVLGSAFKIKMNHGKPEGLSCRIDYDGKSIPIRAKGLFGRHNALALLAAAAVGIREGLNLIEISEGLEKITSQPGRLRLIEGQKGSLILDDTYNASPIALQAALEVLKELPAQRKIAVLGDMLELGKYSSEAHRKAGELARAAADVVITVGIRTKNTSQTNAWFSNSQEASGYIKELVREGDLVLIKGSQSVRMERIVKAVMAHPEEAHHLLVRQDQFWLSR